MSDSYVVIDRPINGYIYELINNGYGNVEFIVNGKIFKGNREFISITNSYLKAMIDSSNGSNQIMIERVSPAAFEQCMRLLGGAKVDISVANCIELLVAAVVLQIDILSSKTSEFIIANINEQIVTQFLKNLEILTNVDRVEEKMVEYLVQHGHIYFDNNHIYLLSVQELYYICQIENMIIPSEKYLLDRILQYYNEMRKRYSGDEAEEFTENIKNIIKYIHYGDDCIRELYRLRLYEDTDESTRVNRVYFKPSSTDSINNCLIELYNSDKNAFHLPENMKETLQKIGNLVDLILPIVTDKETNDKTFINCLTILLECQIEEPFKEPQDFIDSFTRLIILYDKVTKDHQLNYTENNVLECFLLFSMKYAEALRDKLGSAKLVTILQYYGVLKEQDAVTMCERLKQVCYANDFQCLEGLLNLNIVEDQQFWEYICQCVPMTAQNMPFNPVSGAMPGAVPGMPSGYIYPGGSVYVPNQPMGYIPPQSPPNNQPPPFIPQSGDAQPPQQPGFIPPQQSQPGFIPPPFTPVQPDNNLPIPVIDQQQQQQQQQQQPLQQPPFFQPQQQ